MLWGAIAATAYSFHGISPLASYLMLPYQAWVTLASVLNYSVWQKNKEKDE
jgi:tryptophan-rich sensory protein